MEGCDSQESTIVPNESSHEIFFVQSEYESHPWQRNTLDGYRGGGVETHNPNRT